MTWVRVRLAEIFGGKKKLRVRKLIRRRRHYNIVMTAITETRIISLINGDLNSTLRCVLFFLFRVVFLLLSTRIPLTYGRCGTLVREFRHPVFTVRTVKTMRAATQRRRNCDKMLSQKARNTNILARTRKDLRLRVRRRDEGKKKTALSLFYGESEKERTYTRTVYTRMKFKFFSFVCKW